MADTFTSALKARKIEQGAYSNSYADRFNADMVDVFDAAIAGVLEIDIGSSTTHSLAAMTNGTLSDSHYFHLRFVGTPASAVTVTVPASVTPSKEYLVENQTGQQVTFKYAATSGVVIQDEDIVSVRCDGTNVREAVFSPRFKRLAAEITASVTPSDFSFAQLPRIDLRRYGLSTSASGATNRAAIERAVDVAGALGGAILVAPPGTFVIDATVAIVEHNTIIEGQGQGATIWSFDPASPDVLFDFATNSSPVSSIVRSGIRDCGFFSSNSTTKTAVQITDGRQCFVERVAINDGNWPGSGSIGVRTFGRDFLKFRHCDIECARPWLISVNPNSVNIHVDLFEIFSCQFATTETTGKNVEVETGVEISNMRFVNCDFARGKYGFFWDDTTTTIASYKLAFINCRSEQTTDSAGYSIYLASTAQNLQDLYLENCHLDPGMNGLYCRKVHRITLNNSTFVGGSGRTNLDITFESMTELLLQNTLMQPSSTITLTSGLACVEMPWSTASSAMARTGFWRYDEGALVSRKSRRQDGVLSFKYKGTVADDGQLNLPVLSSGGADVAVFRVAAKTGATLAYAHGAWMPGTAPDIYGTTGLVSNTSVDGDLCVIDNTNALSVINRMGGTADIVIDVAWSD